jgi:hypothetical protein
MASHPVGAPVGTDSFASTTAWMISRPVFFSNWGVEV